jgi:hypothetical protein
MKGTVAEVCRPNNSIDLMAACGKVMLAADMEGVSNRPPDFLQEPDRRHGRHHGPGTVGQPEGAHDPLVRMSDKVVYNSETGRNEVDRATAGAEASARAPGDVASTQATAVTF